MATEECKLHRCSGCGVCDFEVLQNRLADEPLVGGRLWVVRSRRAWPTNLQPTTHHQVVASGTPKTPPAFPLAPRRPPGAGPHLPPGGGAADVLSEGYMPRPRLSAGPSLATGWTSVSEWVDLELSGATGTRIVSKDCCEQLNRCAAPGLRFLAAGVLSGAVSFPERLRSSAARTARRSRSRRSSPPSRRSTPAAGRSCRGTRCASSGSAGARRMTVDLRPLVYDLAALDGRTVALEAADGQRRVGEADRNTRGGVRGAKAPDAAHQHSQDGHPARRRRYAAGRVRGAPSET